MAQSDTAVTAERRQLMDMIFNCWGMQAVGEAARLGIADQLTGGPKSSDELAAATGANPDALYRLLRSCASVGVFTEHEGRRFSMNKLAESLRTDISGSLRDFVIAQLAPAQWLPWNHIHEAVMTGAPITKKALGMEIWDYYAKNAEEGAQFARAMGNVSAMVSADVVRLYDVTPFKKIVDVGGSQGALLRAMVRAAPNARGILLDLPNVIERARPVIAKEGLADRIEPIGGDFFKDVPAGADLYAIKSVLHDWGDEQCETILRNCHRAAPPGGRLLVVDMILPTKPPPSSLASVDLKVLMLLGGRERTEAEMVGLLTRTGWRVERIIPMPELYSIVDAVRV
ncbi:acetylserotonin O-methyltransferase [Hyalangium versicolor]|uniref:acetylserotonin O-methyltransferase n=1 Tax=Hyalangium versicolor TaxID=2861190 RepID=UPI001CCF1984|nr:acetylserotonin O-methyltransferase [Hyalangium versicolor]